MVQTTFQKLETAETIVNKLVKLGYTPKDIEQAIDRYTVSHKTNTKILEKVK